MHTFHTLSDFRATFASALGTTPGSWKNAQIELGRWRRQLELLTAEALGEEGITETIVPLADLDMVSTDDTRGFQVSPPATPESCGALIIAAMIRGDRTSLAPRVMLRWHSTLVPPVGPGASPPVVDNVHYLHELMVTLLMSPEEAAELERIETAREFAATTFAWKSGAQSSFEARDVDEIAKRDLILGRGDLLTVSMLSGRRIHEMAQWLARARDGPELAPRRVREKASTGSGT